MKAWPAAFPRRGPTPMKNGDHGSTSGSRRSGSDDDLAARHDDELDFDDLDVEESTLDGRDEGLFGFSSDDGEWLELVREYSTADALGGIGPYEILDEVGRGSQGVVYRGRQPGIGRDIALKRLIAGSFSSESTRERFRREMSAAASLNHPSIVTIHGFEIVDGLPLMAMEWIDGETITRWARPRNGPPRSARDCAEVFLQLCDAVRHAHQHGVLHRDLKPSNVLVSANGRPHVLDFGLAKQLAPDGGVSVTREFVGTMGYASPEQFGADQLDVRSDVYSLGVILYEMLTGERPYKPEEGIADFLSALDRDSFTRPSALRGELEQEIDWVCAKALTANRAERYQTVDALAADLHHFLAGEAVSAHPPSLVYELRKLVARNRTVSALAAALVVGSIAGAIFFARQTAVIAQRAEEVAAARDAEAAARAHAEALLELEAAQRKSAQLAWRETFTTLRFLRDDVLLAADPRHAGPDTTLREALSSAADRIGPRLGHSPIIRAFVRRTLGEILWRLGLYEDAEAQLLASYETGRDRGAELTKAAAGVILAGMYLELGDAERAEPLLEEARTTLAAFPNRDQAPYWLALDLVVGLYIDTGRLEEAEVTLRDMEELAERIRSEFPGYECAARLNRGRLLLARGDAAGAVALLTRNLEACQPASGANTHDLARLLGVLAEANLADGDIPAARKAAQRSLSVLRDTLREDHPDIPVAEALYARTLEEP